MTVSAFARLRKGRQIIGISGLTRADPSDLADQLQSVFEPLTGVEHSPPRGHGREYGLRNAERESRLSTTEEN
jgi:hypothetical protein